MKSSCSDEALGHLAYDTLEARREKHVYKLVKKCINGKMSQYFINYFTFNRDIVNRTTRQSNLLHLPRVRTEIAKHSFYYNGYKICNRYQ